MFRLRELRKQQKMSQEDLAKILGVTQATLSGWENEKYEIDNSSLLKCAEYFNVTVDYLLGRDESPSTVDIELNHFNNIFPVKKHKIPLLGEIACGEPIFAVEDRESYVEVGTDINADFCLKAKGDSMINARIMDGDIVFIRQQPMVENGEIAAVIIDNEATLKRVYFNKDVGQLILSPENTAYSPLVYTGEELNNIRILGKAIAFQSDVI